MAIWGWGWGLCKNKQMSCKSCSIYTCIRYHNIDYIIRLFAQYHAIHTVFLMLFWLVIMPVTILLVPECNITYVSDLSWPGFYKKKEPWTALVVKGIILLKPSGYKIEKGRSKTWAWKLPTCFPLSQVPTPATIPRCPIGLKTNSFGNGSDVWWAQWCSTLHSHGCELGADWPIFPPAPGFMILWHQQSSSEVK